jgi:hypothetical protein
VNAFDAAVFGKNSVVPVESCGVAAMRQVSCQSTS